MPDPSPDEIWKDDLLDRRADAEILVRFLLRRIDERKAEGRTRSYVLNIDSEWGQGKTFFLKRLERQLRSMGFLVAYVNAWEDDHADDPLLAVMSAIDEVISSNFKPQQKARKLWSSVKGSGLEIAVIAGKSGLKKLAQKVVGEGLDEIADVLDEGDAFDESTLSELSAEAADTVGTSLGSVLDRQADKLLKDFRRGQTSIKSFRQRLGTMLAGLAANSTRKRIPLFVLVDELDRCRPSYAIALLERVKHLFDVDNVVFIVATDSRQLQSSIKAVYGAEFDSARYLLRFFDRSYQFPRPDLWNFVGAIFLRHALDGSRLSSPANNDHQAFFVNGAKAFNLSLRDAEQCFDILRNTLTIWPFKAAVELVYLMPLIMAFQQGRTDVWDALESRNPERIKEGFSRIGSWSVGLMQPAKQNKPASRVRVSIEDMLVALSQIKNSLPSITSQDQVGISPAKRWILSRFEAEFTQVHNGTYTVGNEPKSVLLDYPSMVRSAGRFHSSVELID